MSAPDHANPMRMPPTADDDAAEMTTEAALQALKDTFETLGGAVGLAYWAVENPSRFYTLYARLIPAVDAAQAQTAFAQPTDVPLSPVLTLAEWSALTPK